MEVSKYTTTAANPPLLSTTCRYVYNYRTLVVFIYCTEVLIFLLFISFGGSHNNSPGLDVKTSGEMDQSYIGFATLADQVR